MEWQQIIGFYHVARLGTFTKAAEATYRTQPALSHQVRSLEEELGCLLIERIGKRRLRLTPAGEAVFAFAADVLERYDLLRASLDDLQGTGKGALALAAPFTTLYHLLPYVLQAYREQFPRVQLTILDRDQTTVIGLVKNGEVDFGFVLQSLAPADLLQWPWKKVQTVLMTPVEHPLTRLSPVTLEEIAGYPLILPPRTGVHAGGANVEARLRQSGLPYRVAMESSNVDLSSVYVEMGLGISFATVVGEVPALKNRNLAFIPLDHYFAADCVAAVASKQKNMPPYKTAFLKLLLKESPVGS